MHRNRLFIACVFFLAGVAFVAITNNRAETPHQASTNISPVSHSNVATPFSTVATDNHYTQISELSDEVANIKLQLRSMQSMLDNINLSKSELALISTKAESIGKAAPDINQRYFTIERLILGGIDPVLAEDLVRRKNNQELKMLALQDKAKRENYIDTSRYNDEVAIVEQQVINLRNELGDEQYDDFLYNSKQTNRIKISSVMLGSNAEQAGIIKGDIILSYDNKRLFNWQELKSATTEGNLGEYVSISISRDGEIFSFSVPRGPLGMKLGVARLQP